MRSRFPHLPALPAPAPSSPDPRVCLTVLFSGFSFRLTRRMSARAVTVAPVTLRPGRAHVQRVAACVLSRCALEVIPNLFTRGRLIREKRLFRHKGKAHIQTFPGHLVEQKAGTTTEAETANRVPPAPFPVGIRVLHVRQRLLLGFRFGFLLGHKGLALFNSVLK